MKDMIISARMDAKDVDYIARYAYSNDMSISNLVRVILEAWITANKDNEVER